MFWKEMYNAKGWEYKGYEWSLGIVFQIQFFPENGKFLFDFQLQMGHQHARSNLLSCQRFDTKATTFNQGEVKDQP